MMNHMSTPPNTYGAKWMNIPVEYPSSSAPVRPSSSHCQQVEQVAERKKAIPLPGRETSKAGAGNPEIVPALLGLYTDAIASLELDFQVLFE